MPKRTKQQKILAAIRRKNNLNLNADYDSEKQKSDNSGISTHAYSFKSQTNSQFLNSKPVSIAIPENFQAIRRELIKTTLLACFTLTIELIIIAKLGYLNR